MAAKKSSKKKVTVTVDPEHLKTLAEAAEALSEIASAMVWWIDDPTVRAKLTKGRKRPKKR